MIRKIFFAYFLFVANSFASSADYAKYFEIDLDAPLPSIAELQKKYFADNPEYDRKYEFGWNIGEKFDKIFAQTIKIYGTSEQRLKTANEEQLLKMLNSVPKESWEYIGPYLHTIAGMSDKILNLPGIKETKNQFPKRIAPQLAGIENLEFLSPHMYYVLMPEIWPENAKPVEFPQTHVPIPKVVYDEKFYQKLLVLLPMENFAGENFDAPKITKSDLRTINITKDSALTSGDVKAFAQTLDGVEAFGKKDAKILNIIAAGAFLDIWEAENQNAIPVNQLKDLVNPCQRLAQKIIIAGQENEFLLVVGTKGFDLKTWAWTCDKTIKAHRMLNMSQAMVLALKQYQKGFYNSDVYKLPVQDQSLQFSIMQSIMEMYKAPLNDILEVQKNRDMLSKQFIKSTNMILSSPIARTE